jgi:Histidine kinase-, DNA gyrase B-, and HSP90-like ATPase
MQQADGRNEWDARQNPDKLFYNVETNLNTALQSGLSPGGPSGNISSYRPWLETVAPLNRGEDDRAVTGMGEGAGLLQSFRPTGPTESLSSLIHDACNMIAAMDLYCDLLEEPGVLATPFIHYAGELRLVGGASRRLLEKLAVLDHGSDGATSLTKSGFAETGFAESGPGEGGSGESGSAESLTGSPLENRMEDVTPPLAAACSASPTATDAIPVPPFVQEGRPHRAKPRFFPYGEPIQDLAADLLANQNLLSSLAGPGVTVALSLSGGHRPIAMAGEDLTRVLVNLCRNAVEVMPQGGLIQIELSESPESLLLSLSDSGPGIPETSLESIFSSGFSSHQSLPRGAVFPTGASSTDWPAQHRGLGLAIVRSLVSAAGGSVWAANRKSDPERGNTTQTGAVISLEFPLLHSHRGT